MATDDYGDGVKAVDASIEDIIAYCNNSGRFNVICMQERPGIKLFLTKLEHEHFSPNDQVLNDEFQFFMIGWQGMMFFVASIPADKKHLAYEIAGSTNMRIADGTPTLLGGDEALRFPIDGPNSFTLENGHDHPAYSGGDRAEMERAEIEECERIQEATLAAD